jgi:hypothetical protein
MYIRVVRFTDVDPDRYSALLARINEQDGPPEGLESTGLKMLHDPAQGTAVAIQEFPTAEAMAEGARILSGFDSADTPGTRTSVDECELKLELEG